MYIYDNISRISSWDEKVQGQSCRENQNTHFMFSTFPPPENSAVYEIKYCSAGQPTDDNMARALCLLDT